MVTRHFYSRSVCMLCVLVVILYADDTVLFAYNEDDFKSTFNTFYNYCEHWKLDSNFSQTKAMMFGDKMRRHRTISKHGHTIEEVDSFTYLGVVFQRIDHFQTKKRVIEQSRKALFCSFRNLDLPIDCQLRLFDNALYCITSALVRL
mgnify:FL=1